ncbi:MAG: hypothetical protein HOO97_02905 [Sideroxydans sp.]|nr:hypothetical protein [Sideroxydans sp.]NOT98030.1 hypothetical protein [Sideroxydans sp.]
MGLDTIELVLSSEKHFGVSVPDERAEKTITVEQFAQLLYELRTQTANPMPFENVILELQQLVSKQFKIPIEKVLPDAEFVKDLGLS